MSEIDQTSAALGRIEATISAVAAANADVRADITAVRTELHALSTAVSGLQAKVAEMEPEVKTLRALRNRGIGIIAGATIAAGALGTLAWNGLKNLFNGT